MGGKECISITLLTQWGIEANINVGTKNLIAPERDSWLNGKLNVVVLHTLMLKECIDSILANNGHF